MCKYNPNTSDILDQLFKAVLILSKKEFQKNISDRIKPHWKRSIRKKKKELVCKKKNIIKMYLTTSKNDHRLTWKYTCSLTAIVVRFRAITVKIFTLHDFVYIRVGQLRSTALTHFDGPNETTLPPRTGRYR